MNLLFLLLTLTITGGVSSFQVIGSVGGTVGIWCDFPNLATLYIERQQRYFCRVDESGNCKKLISAIGKEGELGNLADSGRYTLRDAGFGGIQVIIRELRKEDEGTYHCEITGDHQRRTEVILSVKDVPGQRSIELTGLVGEDVSITCFYPQRVEKGFSIDRQFCKEEWKDYCDDKITLKSHRSNEMTNTEGRWSMSLNSTDNFYTVSLSGRTVQDVGIYWCRTRIQGFDRDDEGVYYSYSTKVLLMVQGRLGSFPVIGTLGGTLKIQCDLPAHITGRKPLFLCRGTESNCTMLARVEADQRSRKPVNNMKVFLSNLKKEEEGTYLCGVEEESGPNTYTELVLTVKEVPDQKLIQETVPSGGSVSITGFYPAEHRNSSKFFCRGGALTISSNCETQIALKPNAVFHKYGRFSMTDNSTENFSTVTISDLAWFRTGSYWFGVSRTEKGGRYWSYHTLLELKVEGGEGESKPLGGAGGLGGLLAMFGMDIGGVVSQIADALPED